MCVLRQHNNAKAAASDAPWFSFCFTCDRGEVYPDQQSEEAGDVSQDVAVRAGSWTIRIHV